MTAPDEKEMTPAEVANLYKDLVAGEQKAAMMEKDLDALEKMLDDLLTSMGGEAKRKEEKERAAKGKKDIDGK